MSKQHHSKQTLTRAILASQLIPLQTLGNNTFLVFDPRTKKNKVVRLNPRQAQTIKKITSIRTK